MKSTFVVFGIIFSMHVHSQKLLPAEAEKWNAKTKTVNHMRSVARFGTATMRENVFISIQESHIGFLVNDTTFQILFEDTGLHITYTWDPGQHTGTMGYKYLNEKGPPLSSSDVLKVMDTAYTVVKNFLRMYEKAPDKKKEKAPEPETVPKWNEPGDNYGYRFFYCPPSWIRTKDPRGISSML